MEYEPITIGQLKAFTGAFMEHPDYSRIYQVAKTLTKTQAHQIVNTFYGTNYSQMKAVSETARENAKTKIPKALSMLEKYGYVERCRLCTEPRATCVC